MFLEVKITAQNNPRGNVCQSLDNSITIKLNIRRNQDTNNLVYWNIDYHGVYYTLPSNLGEEPLFE